MTDFRIIKEKIIRTDELIFLYQDEKCKRKELVDQICKLKLEMLSNTSSFRKTVDEFVALKKDHTLLKSTHEKFKEDYFLETNNSCNKYQSVCQELEQCQKSLGKCQDQLLNYELNLELTKSMKDLDSNQEKKSQEKSPEVSRDIAALQIKISELSKFNDSLVVENDFAHKEIYNLKHENRKLRKKSQTVENQVDYVHLELELDHASEQLKTLMADHKIEIKNLKHKSDDLVKVWKTKFEELQISKLAIDKQLSKKIKELEVSKKNHIKIEKQSSRINELEDLIKTEKIRFENQLSSRMKDLEDSTDSSKDSGINIEKELTNTVEELEDFSNNEGIGFPEHFSYGMKELKESTDSSKDSEDLIKIEDTKFEEQMPIIMNKVEDLSKQFIKFEEHLEFKDGSKFDDIRIEKQLELKDASKKDIRIDQGYASVWPHFSDSENDSVVNILHEMRMCSLISPFPESSDNEELFGQDDMVDSFKEDLGLDKITPHQQAIGQDDHIEGGVFKEDLVLDNISNTPHKQDLGHTSVQILTKKEVDIVQKHTPKQHKFLKPVSTNSIIAKRKGRLRKINSTTDRQQSILKALLLLKRSKVNISLDKNFVKMFNGAKTNTSSNCRLRFPNSRQDNKEKHNLTDTNINSIDKLAKLVKAKLRNSKLKRRKTKVLISEDEFRDTEVENVLERNKMLLQKAKEENRLKNCYDSENSMETTSKKEIMENNEDKEVREKPIKEEMKTCFELNDCILVSDLKENIENTLVDKTSVPTQSLLVSESEKNLTDDQHTESLSEHILHQNISLPKELQQHVFDNKNASPEVLTSDLMIVDSDEAIKLSGLAEIIEENGSTSQQDVELYQIEMIENVSFDDLNSSGVSVDADQDVDCDEKLSDLEANLGDICTEDQSMDENANTSITSTKNDVNGTEVKRRRGRPSKRKNSEITPKSQARPESRSSPSPKKSKNEFRKAIISSYNLRNRQSNNELEKRKPVLKKVKKIDADTEKRISEIIASCTNRIIKSDSIDASIEKATSIDTTDLQIDDSVTESIENPKSADIFSGIIDSGYSENVSDASDISDSRQAGQKSSDKYHNLNRFCFGNTSSNFFNKNNSKGSNLNLESSKNQCNTADQDKSKCDSEILEFDSRLALVTHSKNNDVNVYSKNSEYSEQISPRLNKIRIANVPKSPNLKASMDCKNTLKTGTIKWNSKIVIIQNTLLKAADTDVPNSTTNDYRKMFPIVKPENEQKKGGFKRPNISKIIPRCPRSPEPTRVEVPAIEPRIIPLEKPDKLNLNDVGPLFRRLIMYSKEDKVVEEVSRKFLGQDSEYIAKLILEQVALDREAVDKTCEPAPPMTPTQRTLFGFMIYLEKHSIDNLLNNFLKCAELRLYCTKTSEEVAPITRLYVAICRYKKDILRVRKMVCESFYFMGDLAVLFLTTCLKVWVELLPLEKDSKDYPLIKVIVQLVNMKTCNSYEYNLTSLKYLLHKFYGYPQERWRSEDVFEELFAQYLKNPGRELDFPILIFCKNHPSKWVFDTVERTLKQIVGQTLQENYKATVIILIGNIFSQFLDPEDQKYVDVIRQWLNSLKDDNTPEIIKKSICLSLRRLPKQKNKKKKKITL